jgi:hypothetical protein
MDAGAKARLDILRSDVERKMIEPLRMHGWTASIEREFTDGLILTAERGGHPHPVRRFSRRSSGFCLANS